MDNMPARPSVQPYLDVLRELPFVQEVRFSEDGKKDVGIDGILTLKTPQKTHVFFVQQKRSYLDNSVLHAAITQAKAHRNPIFLFARYVPTPSAERLMEAGINFIDQTGNIHLNLGKNYERTVIGKKERTHSEQRHRLTPAVVQLLFAFAANAEAASWSVRQLADVAGLSKSNVAKLRQQLIDEGIFRQTDKGVHIADSQKLEDELLQGYELALRPKLYLGRFRAPESNLDQILIKAREGFTDIGVLWSLTGGAGAYSLQHFYRGPEMALFVEPFSDALRRRMRLIPDKAGPLIFLRPFGTLPFWREMEGNWIANPWLIYAELMHSNDARAHEAAQEIKRRHLVPDHA